MLNLVVRPKCLSETRTDVIDFAPDLPATATISAANGTCSVYTGVDANPAALLATVAVSSSGTSATVRYGAGVVGTIYQIRIDANTTFGVYSASYLLAVIPDQV
jgi:hypothetical protein